MTIDDMQILKPTRREEQMKGDSYANLLSESALAQESARKQKGFSLSKRIELQNSMNNKQNVKGVIPWKVKRSSSAAEMPNK